MGRAAVAKRAKRARRNPVDAAAELSEVFHGRPAKSETVIVEELREHSVLTDLGELTELTVLTRKGSTRFISFDAGTRLASNEDGTQLYIEGGDQSVDLDDFQLADTNKERVTLGQCTALVYECEKDHLGDGYGPYEHQMGEDGGSPPDLIYDVMNERLSFSGGTYHIDRDMDLGQFSAGIRN